MLKRICVVLLPAFLLTAGCASTEPLEAHIQELEWKLDSAEQAAEQSTVDKRLAEREVEQTKKDAQMLKERLALAYDALREARTKLDEGLKDRITELSESGPGQALSISQYGGVVLESGILFAPGRHELTKGGEAALQPLVDTLLKSEYDVYEIELAGHTDSDPIVHSKQRYRDNWDLAGMRSNSVRGFLVKAGITANRIYLSSWGPSKPLVSDQKAQNRRVEIVLHKQTDALPASAGRTEGPSETDGEK